MRIVTLLPSATEIVCALGLTEQLVGVSHECDFPVGVSDLPHVTRTHIDHDASSAAIDRQVREELSQANALYSLDAECLAELDADIIVTQSLCDVCAVADSEVHEFVKQSGRDTKVVNIEPLTLADVMSTIRRIGEAAQVADRATRLVNELQARLSRVAERSAKDGNQRSRVAFLEWIDPPFCGGHWNPELVSVAGGKDCLGRAGQPSRTIDVETIAQANPDLLFVACCGFDLRRSLHELRVVLSAPSWQALPVVKEGAVYVCDGNAYFSRPGPRLIDSAEILAHTLNPDLHPPGPELATALRL